MEAISNKDREILRDIARRYAEHAHSQRNEEVLKQWDALAHGRRETPTVRLLFSSFGNEVIDPRLRCEGRDARTMEYSMLKALVGRELFHDDTPISPVFLIQQNYSLNPFGIWGKKTWVETSGKKFGYHIDPIITDLDEQLDLLKNGSFNVDVDKTQERMDFAQDIFGDILPIKKTMLCLQAAITYYLVNLMGMENYYLAMYDSPEALHAAMEIATTFYERYYDYLEENNLLLPTTDFAPISQESFAFNSELPSENVTKTTQCWGFMESQETTSVSAETFGEFVYPYQDRLAKRFGLLTYGCCERVDATWLDYLSKWKNLRKLSVSPFNNENLVGEYLRGSNVIFYSKPRAEYVTNPGPLDEDALRIYFKGVCEAASGCLFEMAQREVGTIFGDYERGRRYVQIARECIDQYWKP